MRPWPSLPLPAAPRRLRWRRKSSISCGSWRPPRLPAMDDGPIPVPPCLVVPQSIWRRRGLASEQRRGQSLDTAHPQPQPCPLTSRVGRGCPTAAGRIILRYGGRLIASEACVRPALETTVVTMEVVRRELRGSAIALVMVAATTLVAYVLIQSLDVRRGSVIYLLPVLLAGWHLGLIPALVAAVAGVLWSGYFFFSPYYS